MKEVHSIAERRTLFYHPESECHFVIEAGQPIDMHTAQQCDDVTDMPTHEEAYKFHLANTVVADWKMSSEAFTFFVSLKQDIQNLAGIVQNGNIEMDVSEVEEWKKKFNQFLVRLKHAKDLTEKALVSKAQAVDAAKHGRLGSF